jgi:hypothetical protein
MMIVMKIQMMTTMMMKVMMQYKSRRGLSLSLYGKNVTCFVIEYELFGRVHSPTAPRTTNHGRLVKGLH